MGVAVLGLSGLRVDEHRTGSASALLQARLEIGAREFDFRPEPPGFLVHVELGGELVSHLQPLSRPD